MKLLQIKKSARDAFQNTQPHCLRFFFVFFVLGKNLHLYFMNKWTMLGISDGNPTGLCQVPRFATTPLPQTHRLSQIMTLNSQKTVSVRQKFEIPAAVDWEWFEQVTERWCDSQHGVAWRRRGGAVCITYPRRSVRTPLFAARRRGARHFPPLPPPSPPPTSRFCLLFRLFASSFLVCIPLRWLVCIKTIPWRGTNYAPPCAFKPIINLAKSCDTNLFASNRKWLALSMYRRIRCDELGGRGAVTFLVDRFCSNFYEFLIDLERGWYLELKILRVF